MFRISLVFIFAVAGETMECGTFVHHTVKMEIPRDSFECHNCFLMFVIQPRCASFGFWAAVSLPFKKYNLDVRLLVSVPQCRFHPRIKSKPLWTYFPKEESRQIWKKFASDACAECHGRRHYLKVFVMSGNFCVEWYDEVPSPDEWSFMVFD